MDLTTLLALLAAVFAGFTLLVAGRQLQVAKDSIGGHGMSVAFARTEEPKKGRDGISRKPWKASVYVVGPGKRSEVAVHLDGVRVIGSPLEVHPELAATSPPIVVRFQASDAEESSGWIVVTWSEPKGQGVVRRAMRFSLSESPTEEWRWNTFMAVRVWWRRRRAPLTNWRPGTPTKPLGKWIKIRDLSALPGEGPTPVSDRRRERRLHPVPEG